MTEEEIVHHAWEDDSKYISKFWIERQRPQELRFVIRDGKYILQQNLLTHVKFSKPLWIHGDFDTTDKKYLWFDIPVAEETYE